MLFCHYVFLLKNLRITGSFLKTRLKMIILKIQRIFKNNYYL